MWVYNQHEHPPAPFLDLIVHPIEKSNQTVPIQAKIDTGTDISALPESIVAYLNLPIVSKLIVEGYDGRQTTVSTYAAVLEIATVRFRSQEFIAIPEAHALLGRDILNHFYVLLNGPGLNLQIQSEPFTTQNRTA